MEFATELNLDTTGGRNHNWTFDLALSRGAAEVNSQGRKPLVCQR
jgi:hypothetical protein